MKFRNGFVSNSSSSSFTISRSKLSKIQIKRIHDHIFHASKRPDLFPWLEEWEIKEDDDLDIITGFTWMDNFDMEMYLRDFVKVADEDIIWDRDDG